MIVARDVTHQVGGTRILDGVSMDVTSGEVLALVGPNGAGKSTMLRILSGEIAPTSGDVTLAGKPPPSGPPR